MEQVKKHCLDRLCGKQITTPAYSGPNSVPELTAELQLLRQDIIAEYRHRQKETIEVLQAHVQIAIQEKQLATTLFQQSSLNLFACKMLRENPGSLRDKLRAPSPVVRLLTLQVVARRRLPLETEVIERLGDPSPVVSQAARETLVRLARGTDFGPLPGTAGVRRRKAIQKWKDWLALQKVARESPAPTGPAVASKPAVRFNPALAMRNILAQQAALRTEDAEVQRLSKELVAAKGERQGALLDRLKTSKGGVYTDALAQAIPRLPAAMQTKARDALAERLTRMKATTLKDKLQDEDAEVRRAAALACAMKEARAQIPDLIPLLLDSERSVAAAAHAALKDLTGRDFGPHAKATAGERTLALLAWRDWWKTQQAKRK
jgi:HEAT repeat protein